MEKEAKTQQDTVAVVSILVDAQGNVVDVCRTMVSLEARGDKGRLVVPEAVCLDAMHAQRHLRADKRRFRLEDILTYFIVVDDDDEALPLQTLPAVPMDIEVPPTVAMFHALNRVWLIFRQEVQVSRSNKKPLGGGGILKQAGEAKSVKKHVRISQELPRYKNLIAVRKTIKIHY